MRNTDTFRQYIWLVDTIRMSRKIELKRIQELWIEDGLNDRKPLSRTTFHRLKIAIEDMFGIRIECDNQHQYFISNPETLKDNSTQNWMLQTLTINNVLIDSLSIKDRLVLEETPEGLEYLQTIIKAIKNNHVLFMTHRSFDKTESQTHHIKPYCLKAFLQRWYLLGKTTQNDELRIFALDRITDLEITKQTFQMDPNFNANSFFKNYFGVFIGKEHPERVVLRAYGNMAKFLRTLPKHPSQKEVATTDTYADFEYFLVPSCLDFRQAILKEGSELEVIEPESLRNEIKIELQTALFHYQHQLP